MAKAAIIGCGHIAGRLEDFSAFRTYSHAKAYHRNEDFEGIALFDRDATNAETLARKVGGAAFDSVERLLGDFRPDVVSICTPDDHHADYLGILLRHPAPPTVIFCEKPVCQTKAELAQV